MRKLNLFSKKKKKNAEILPVANSGETALAEKTEENKKSSAESTPVNSKIYIYEHGFDRPMLIIILLLSLFGLIMVYSSSYVYAHTYYGNSTYFVLRQAIILIPSIIIMLVMTKFGYKIIKIFTVLVFLIATLLLVAVLFIGTSEGEAQRWIFIGPVSFQPSELMKIAMILMIARISSKYKHEIHNKKKFWKSTLYGLVIPGAIIALSCLLVLLEKHLSGTIILFLIGFAMIWANGSPRRWSVTFVIIVGSVIGLVLFLIENYPQQVKDIVPDYMFTRVDSWMHP